MGTSFAEFWLQEGVRPPAVRSRVKVKMEDRSYDPPGWGGRIPGLHFSAWRPDRRIWPGQSSPFPGLRITSPGVDSKFFTDSGPYLSQKPSHMKCWI